MEILASYNFEIEYRKGKGHSNADGMSRCVTPWECKCNNVDLMEPLKCGPCKKCSRRVQDMQSSLQLECHDNVRIGGSRTLQEELPRTSRDTVEAVGESIDICPVEAPLGMEQSVDSIMVSKVEPVMGVSKPEVLRDLRSGNNRARTTSGALLDGTEGNILNIRAVETRSDKLNLDGGSASIAGGSKDSAPNERALPVGPVISTEDYLMPDKVILGSLKILGSFKISDLQQMQISDPDIEYIHKRLRDDNGRPTSTEMIMKTTASRHYWTLWESLRIINGVLV